jgi:transposase
MRKIKEVLRLDSLGLKQQQIALSCAVSQSTVSEYLKAAAAAGIHWPAVADWDDRRLQESLYPGRPVTPPRRQCPQPDFAAIHQELQTHKHVTLQLLWEEYRQEHPEGYHYSRFCDLYRRWRKRQEVVLRQTHRAGEKLFVDWAGDTVPIYDPQTGEVLRTASVFVAVMGASSYAYAESTGTQTLPDWIGAHIRAFEFLGGVPEIVVPDNPKTGVTKVCRYEPDLNRTYQAMAAHYGVAVIPARRGKPKDKAKVEAGVLLVERWILAALRKQKFTSQGALNQAIAELLVRLNQRPFRKREGSRQSLFETLDRPVLRPLPANRYEFGDWQTAKVNIDHHVEFDRHYYSVPYQLTGRPVEIHATATTVEILHRGMRVASHPRSSVPYQATTTTEHRPKSHQKHLEWTPSRMIEWARTVGPATAELFQQIIASKPHPEMGYRSCLGILRLGKQYSLQRLEAAARRAVRLRACSYKSIKSILNNKLDRLPPEEPAAASPPLEHPNIRGADYFDEDDSTPIE